MDKTETKKAHKKENILIDVKVEADLSAMTWGYRGMGIEKEAKELERAVKEFHDFLRDHRSQDLITLDVQRIYKDICSACGEIWETYTEDDGKECCAQCGAEVENEQTH